MKRAPWILGVLLLFTVAALALLWRGLAHSGRPQREGVASLPELSAPVTVRWNDWGVPHIEAGSGPDLAAALGWIHANDRFTQMELGRRLVSGRLAELVGSAALESDRYYVSMGFREIAEDQEEALDEESRSWLTAYAHGVNAWLRERGSDLPPELRILLASPEPWTIRDSLYFQLQLSHELSFWQGRPEEPRFLWLGVLGPERLRDLLGEPKLHVPNEILELAVSTAARPVDEPGPTTSSPGSNNWAVAPSQTAGDSALVANDPHLGLAQPGVWYQVLLRAPGYEAAGMTVPGLPFVVLGQGPRLAWAFTNVMLDDHDLFFERLHEDGDRVRRGDGWEPIRERIETITTAGGGSESVTVRWTDRGLLLAADPGRGLPPRSLRWAATVPSDAGSVFRTLARAEDVLSLSGRLDAMVGPAQNLVAVDVDGNLLHQPIGRVPDRRQGDGRLPSPAWDDAYGWNGMLGQATNPRRLNPDDGLLVTANHDFLPSGVPSPLVADFDTPYRANRIRQLLEQGDDWTPEAMGRLQADVRSLYALDLISKLSADHDGAAGQAVSALREWDGSMSTGGAAALFALLERELLRRIFGDDDAHHGLPSLAGRSQLVRLLSGRLDERWFDDPATLEREDRSEIVGAALEAAWEETIARFGNDPAGWNYPAMNRLTFAHPLEGLPLIGARWSPGPFEMPGSATTVAAFGGYWDGERIEILYGPSMRWIADPRRPDETLVVIPTGQSGHPWDSHYDDQLDSYLEGRLRPAHWSDAAIEANTVSRLRLEPDRPS